MANTKISLLNPATPLVGDEEIALVQPVTGIKSNAKVTIDEINALAPVQSVNGYTGIVVLTSADVGALASGSNISLLTNDVGYITKTSLSSSATGLTYNNTTGVFSLTAGYVIPTTTEETNWNTAYTNRITSLTVLGSSGAATLTSNVLNIPTYTLAGLGGIGTGLAWLLGSGGLITAINTLTSNIPNGFSFNGTWTATANSQQHMGFTGNLTGRAAQAGDTVNGYTFAPNLATGTTGQTLNAVLINPSFSGTGTFNILNLQNASSSVFKVASNGDVSLINPSFTGSGFFQQIGNNTTKIGGGPAGENFTFGPTNRIFSNVELNSPSFSGNGVLTTSVATFEMYRTFTFASGTTGGIGYFADPTFNTTGSYVGTYIGFNYAPIITSVTGLTQLAFRSTVGGVLLAGSLTAVDNAATITANTKLDIRGTGTTTNNILRMADSTNADRMTFTDNGFMTITGIGVQISSTTSAFIGGMFNTNDGINRNGSGGTLMFQGEPNTRASGSSYQFNFVANHTEPIVAATTRGWLGTVPNALIVNGGATGGTWSYVDAAHTLNIPLVTTATAVVIGYHYNPTLTNVTGVSSHYSFKSTSGMQDFRGTGSQMFIGQTGTARSTATLEVQTSYNSSGANKVLRLASSTNADLLLVGYGGDIISNSTITNSFKFTGQYNTNATGQYIFNIASPLVTLVATASATFFGQLNNYTIAASAATQTITAFALTPTFGSSTFSPTVYGIDYNPTITGSGVAVHYALVTRTGSVLFANSSSDSLTASTRLDVRGISAGTVFRAADSTNASIFSIQDSGSVSFWKGNIEIRDASTYQFQLYNTAHSNLVSFNYVANGTGANYTGSDALSINTPTSGNWYFSNSGLSLSFGAASVFGIDNVGTAHTANVTWMAFGFYKGGPGVSAWVPSTGTGSFTTISVVPVISPTGGTGHTVKGFDYNPSGTFANVTTHLAWRSTSGSMLLANASGDTLTSGVRLDVRGIGTAGFVIRATDNANTQRFTVSEDGYVNAYGGFMRVWAGASAVGFGYQVSGTGVNYTGADGMVIIGASGGGVMYISTSGINLAAGAASTWGVNSGSTAITTTFTQMNFGLHNGGPGTLGFTPSAGTFTFKSIYFGHVISPTGGTNHVVYGIDYNPSGTFANVGTHLAWRSSSGSMLLANASGDTLTSGVRLDVRGTGTTTTLSQRWADSSNNPRVTFSDGGQFSFTSSGSTFGFSPTVGFINFQAVASQGSGNFFAVGNSFTYTAPNKAFAAFYPKLTYGTTIVGAGFEVGDVDVLNSNTTSGTLTMFSVFAGNGTAATATTSFVLVNVGTKITGGATTYNPSAGAGSFTGIRINPEYNTTGTYSGTITGIDYNPTNTSLTGATHLAVRLVSGKVLVGGNTLTSGADILIDLQSTTGALAVPRMTTTQKNALTVGTTQGEGMVSYDLTLHQLQFWNGTAWTPGGGITNTAAANELMKSNGTNAVPSGLFSTTSGDIILGLSTDAGTGRNISVDGSAANINIAIKAKGTGTIQLQDGSGVGFIVTPSSRLLEFTTGIGTIRAASITSGGGGVASNLSITGGNGLGTNDTGGDLSLSGGSKTGTGLPGNVNIQVQSAGKIGFFNTAVVIQQSVNTILVNSVTSGGTLSTIADFTSLTVYATDAATIRNNFFRLSEKVLKLETALRNYGLAVN